MLGSNRTMRHLALRTQPFPRKSMPELHEADHKHEKASRAVGGGSGGALMPPYKVTVKVIGARDLPKMDTFGKCDAYVVLSAGEGQGGKTKKVDKSYDPDFGEEFEFEVRETDATLTVELFDWDKMSKDDLVLDCRHRLCCLSLCRLHNELAGL